MQAGRFVKLGLNNLRGASLLCFFFMHYQFKYPAKTGSSRTSTGSKGCRQTGHGRWVDKKVTPCRMRNGKKIDLPQGLKDAHLMVLA